MAELLRVLADWLSFFFTDGRYRLVDSQVSTAFGDALIELASERLSWRLVRDRTQIFLDCSPPQTGKKKREWYSTDVLICLLTGSRVESSELTEEVAKWIEANLTEIETRFSADRLEETSRELKRLERLRAKEMFG